MTNKAFIRIIVAILRDLSKSEKLEIDFQSLCYNQNRGTETAMKHALKAPQIQRAKNADEILLVP
jgi:hypothetical protein